VAGALSLKALLQRGTRSGWWIPFTRWTVRRLQLGQPTTKTHQSLGSIITHQRVHCGLDAEMGWQGSSAGTCNVSGGSGDLQTVAQRFELRSVWASSRSRRRSPTMTPESSRTVLAWAHGRDVTHKPATTSAVFQLADLQLWRDGA
jgi:hypothetical protein